MRDDLNVFYPGKLIKMKIIFQTLFPQTIVQQKAEKNPSVFLTKLVHSFFLLKQTSDFQSQFLFYFRLSIKTLVVGEKQFKKTNFFFLELFRNLIFSPKDW